MPGVSSAGLSCWRNRESAPDPPSQTQPPGLFTQIPPKQTYFCFHSLSGFWTSGQLLFPYLTSSQIRDNSSRPSGQLTEIQRKGKTFLMKRSYTSSDIEALHFQTNLDICMVFAWFTCLSLQTSMLAELLDTICYFFFFKPS